MSSSKSSTSGRSRFFKPWSKKYNNEKPPISFAILDESENNSSDDDEIRLNPVLIGGPDKDEYIGWKLYHPEEDYDKNSETMIKVKAFETHLTNYQKFYDLMKIREVLWFTLSLHLLNNDEQFVNNWPNFNMDLQEKPEHTISCIELAMHHHLLTLTQTENYNHVLDIVKLRIEDHSPILDLKHLKAQYYGKLITIRGTVIRLGTAQITGTWLTFKCRICNAQQVVKQTDGIMINPISCRDGCRTRSNFEPILTSSFNRTEDFQIIRLQEFRNGKYDSGNIPRNVEVELTKDLVDLVKPAEDIIVTGILKIKTNLDNFRGAENKTQKSYIQCISISGIKQKLANCLSELTEKDIEAIKLIESEPSPFRLLVQSLCPKIYGHEMVKAGLILGLLGGSATGSQRSQCHVLLVGDPGLGKSYMLQACCSASPRGIFVCGNVATNAGLTVAINHEKGTGTIYEPGAVIMADQGLCCIDEFDKMTAHHQALLEVMEQQTVGVAKAGALCTFPARTTIFAVANPSGGHYNKSKTISENINVNEALLSRFDLIFILLDCPNKSLDDFMIGESSYFGGNTSSKSILNDETLALNERLSLKPNEKLDLLPPTLLQKYINYAKKNIKPVPTAEAVVRMKNYYVELRKNRNNGNIPVTRRQFDALIRLTQARSKADLCETVTIKHVEDVLEIMKYGLSEVLNTDTDTVDYQQMKIMNGMSQSAQVRKFIQIIQEKSILNKKKTYTTQELKEIAVNQGFPLGFSILLDLVNSQGVLLKKPDNIYQVIC